MINPIATIGDELIWSLENKVHIVLQWNNLKSKGCLDYLYLPIWNEKLEKDKKSGNKVKDSL